MEVHRYWTLMGRRRWTLVLAPLVAGITAIAIGLLQPARYEAIATAYVPVSAPSPTTIRQMVSDLEALASSSDYFSELARRTGTSRSRLSRLKVAQVKDGSLVEFRYQGTRPANVARVSRAAAHLALDQYLAPQVAGAQQVRDAAQRELDDARKAITDLANSSGVANPRDAYENALQVVSQLRIRQAVVAADPATAGQAAAYTNTIADAQGQADRLSDLVRQYDVLVTARDRAATRLSDATAVLNETISRRDAAAGDEAVVGGSATRIARLPMIVQTVAGSIVIAELLTAGILFLLELRRARPVREEQPPPEHREVLERPTLAALDPASSDRDRASSEPEAASLDGEKASLDAEGASLGAEGATLGAEGATPDRGGATSDAEGASSDPDGATSDREAVTSDSEGATSDSVGATSDSEAASLPADGATSNSDGPTSDADDAPVVPVNRWF